MNPDITVTHEPSGVWSAEMLSEFDPVGYCSIAYSAERALRGLLSMDGVKEILAAKRDECTIRRVWR